MNSDNPVRINDLAAFISRSSEHAFIILLVLTAIKLSSKSLSIRASTREIFLSMPSRVDLPKPDIEYVKIIDLVYSEFFLTHSISNDLAITNQTNQSMELSIEQLKTICSISVANHHDCLDFCFFSEPDSPSLAQVYIAKILLSRDKSKINECVLAQ